MGEKRKPDLVILLTIPGKKSNKVELFRSDEWPAKYHYLGGRVSDPRNRYRIRVNGKWWPENKDGRGFNTYYKSEVFKLLQKSIKI
jgi:hypothetical protein